MISTEELSGLLGTLYSAPLEAEKWQEFMNRLCAVVDISCGYLIGKYEATESSTLVAGGGANFGPEMISLYDEYYAAQDPYVGPALAMQCTGLFEGDSLHDRATLVRSEIYNDFLRRYELESTNVLMCSCTGTQLEGLSLWRGPKHGPLDKDSRQLLGMLLPHLQTALRLRGMMISHDVAKFFTEAALEAMSAAVFLVGDDGSTLHMNRQATNYVRREDIFALRGGRLFAGDSRETAQLEQLLRAATSERHGLAELAPGGAMRLRQPATGSHLQLTVVPAPKHNRFDDKRRYALVFVTDPAERPAPRAEVMRQLYGLTPTECRVADLLLEGTDVREAAERLHITLETARFHLKRVFRKTGARRQAELIRMMMLLPGHANGGIAAD